AEAVERRGRQHGAVEALAGGRLDPARTRRPGKQSEAAPRAVDRRTAVGEPGVGDATSRPAARRVGVYAGRLAFAAAADHGGRAVELAELHRQLVTLLGRRRDDFLGDHPSDVARPGLLDHQPADREAFGFVAVEQRLAGLAPEHRSELPGEVGRVLNARVASEPTG